MYDKYFSVNPFTLGSAKLPKHKGILFNGGTAGTVGTATVHFVNSVGSTLAGSILINSSPYIFPIQVYAITALPSGFTAWYIN
jgi:hypothetical protein